MDLTKLQERLEALGEPTRFELLGLLHEPRTTNEIHLETRRGIPERRKDRSMTRQGVRYHLTKLEDAGLVRTGTITLEGRDVATYEASVEGLFTMMEELHAVTETLAQGFPPTKAPAFPNPPPLPGPWSPEPRLVTVQGINRGETFPLTGKEPNEDQGWVLGKDPDADIQLPWDPLIDGKAAEILPTSEGITLMDYRSADHRVTLNEDPLPRGGQEPLQRGDVLQLGLSILLYQGP